MSPFSYNRLGENADEKDAEEIIELAGKASLTDQQKQVQENVHSHIRTFSKSMDDILLPTSKRSDESLKCSVQANAVPRRSGLSLAVGGVATPSNQPGQWILVYYLTENIL